MTLSRPAKHLINAGKLHPKINKLIDEMRQSKGKDLPNWANFCFMPMAGWYALTCQSLGKPSLGLSDIAQMQVLASTHTWQYSKGMYDFDDDLYKALIDSRIDGDLPSGVLHRLPEWCMYINTPSLSFDGAAVHGFFAHLEHDVNTGGHELRLLLDTDTKFINVPLHLGDWSLLTAVDKYINQAGSYGAKMGQDIAMSVDTADNITHDIMPFVSLLLYLCSDEPDLTNLTAPQDRPQRPKPKKTKNGWRLFPADKVKTWTLGRIVGEQLRQVYASANATGSGKKAHFRRGHYKTYWVGSKDGEQKAVSRWIAPAIVATKRDKT